MTALSVNLNAVAHLRNRREVPWPSLVDIARAVLEAGAHGLTVHPRPDQRHIRFTDVDDLAALLEGEAAEFNIEGYPSDDFLRLVDKARPEQVTLVPDLPGQSTSDHGWDMNRQAETLRRAIASFAQAAGRVSIFVDADPDAPARARELGTDRIELYTGPYGGALEADAAIRELDRLVATADAARTIGLPVNAGHDLTVDNLPPLVKRVPDLAEVSIGHAITADALMHGFPQSVRRYLTALET